MNFLVKKLTRHKVSKTEGNQFLIKPGSGLILVEKYTRKNTNCIKNLFTTEAQSTQRI